MPAIVPPLRRERRTASKNAWRRTLPPPPAANDNRPAARAPAPRTVSLEELLHWTYGRQKAHRYLERPLDWFLWAMDAADLVELPQDRRPVHHDAALVHEAVMALGSGPARFVVENAVVPDWPTPPETSEPRPLPVVPDSDDERGRHVCPNGSRIDYLIKTVEIVSVPREEWEMVGRKKLRRAKMTRWDRWPVRYCPLQWTPDPYEIEIETLRWTAWRECRAALLQTLAGAPLRAHVLPEPAGN